MDREILEIERYPDRGFERFTDDSVTITDEIVTFDPGALDSEGRKVVDRYVTGP